MTIKECTIVTAYTGVLMLKGEYLGELYKYAEELTGISPYTHEFANEAYMELLKEKSKPDFLKLCEEAVRLDKEQKEVAVLLGRKSECKK